MQIAECPFFVENMYYVSICLYYHTLFTISSRTNLLWTIILNLTVVFTVQYFPMCFAYELIVNSLIAFPCSAPGGTAQWDKNDKIVAQWALSKKKLS